MTTSSASGAFAEAYDTVSEVEELVKDRVTYAKETAATLLTSAQNTIDQLSEVNFEFDAGTLPSPPDLDNTISLDITLPTITATSFGSISSTLPDEPTLTDVPTIDDITIPEFTSSINSLVIPEAPTWTSPGSEPSAPTLSDIDIPTAPTITLPDVPTMADVTVPDFDGITLPTFDTSAPEFEGTAVSTVLQWKEPTYATEVLPEVMSKLREMWAGSNGIPPEVEAAMMARAADREELTTARDVDSASEEFSMRGFTMPSGVQTARVDQLRQDLSLKKLSLNREMTIQFAQWQIENVKFACEQGIAAENVLINLFLNQAQRMFEAAKYQVETDMNLYNLQVTLFNAKMNGYQVRASVFNTLVQAALAKVEVFKAEVEAEVARSQVNTQKVQTYSALVQALQTQIEIYKAEMQGAEVKANVIAQQVNVYRAEVEAYATRIQAQKVEFDAYTSRVQGEAAKSSIIQAQATAYAAMIQGKSAGADIEIKRMNAAISSNQLLLQKYTAELEAEKTKINAQVATISASAQAYTADTQRYVAQAQAEETKAQVTVSAQEMELRSNISFYQARVQAYLGNMEQLIRKASASVEALKAAGSVSSTLAAGAMAAVHVGATLSGGGSVSAGASESTSTSTSTTTSTSTSTSYNGGDV